MNILHLSAVKNWGGGGNHIENLCYELSKSNPEVKNHIVVAEGGQFHERLKKSDHSFSTLPMAFKLDPRAIFKFIRLCKQYKIDIVHIHGSTSLTLAIIACRIAGLPPYIFSKKTSFPIKNRKRTLYKYNHPNIKKILCVSETTQSVSAASITDQAKLKVIYHGTRIDNKGTDTPFLLREKFDIASSRKIIGNIGNHVKPKDLETWINTIGTIVHKHKIRNLAFVQIGSFTAFTPALQEKIKEQNLEEYIHFLGYCDKASNFMQQFDIFLMTSQSEGLPQVIYEAFYHHIPVVSTNVGGIPEIIDHGVNGFLSPPKDHESLALNLLELLNNEEMAAKFRKISYDKLIPGFTAENMAKETLKQYEKALDPSVR